MAGQSEQGRGSGKQQGGKSASELQDESDLKEREYRDKEGNIHHHTRAYMEQHKGEEGGSGKSEGGSKSSGGKSEGGSKSQGGGKSEVGSSKAHGGGKSEGGKSGQGRG